MQQDLREAFERELDTEPPLPPGNVAELAMRRGTRLRRRRNAAVCVVAGSVLAVLGTAAGVAVPALRTPSGPGIPAAAPQTSAGDVRVSPVDPQVSPVDPQVSAPGQCGGLGEALVTDLAIFVNQDVTAAEVRKLDADLRADSLVHKVRYQGREEAIARFREFWRASPEVVASGESSLYGVFQVQMKDPSMEATVAARFAGRPGVANIVEPDITVRCDDQLGTGK